MKNHNTIKTTPERNDNRSRTTGQKALSAFYANGHLDTSNSDYKETLRDIGTVTNENTQEYFSNRSRENIEMLNRLSPNLSEVYCSLLENFPGIFENVEFIEIDSDISNQKMCANYSIMKEKDGQYRPAIEYNFRNPKVYYEEDGEERNKPLARFAKQVALRFGVEPEEAIKNKKLLTTFTFLHELGHHLDFMLNYLDPNNNNIPQSLSQYYRVMQKEGMSLPIPENVKHSNLTKEEKEEYKQRFYSRGCSIGLEGGRLINDAKATKYRKMIPERRADELAIYYIMEHFDDYFTNDNSPSNGRLKTRIGDKVVIGKDFAEVLGLEEGSMYSIGDREGFLSENPGKNNSFVLQETDDPDNPGNRVEVGSKIKEVYVVPRLFIKHLSGGKERKIVRNEIRFVDINGNDYAIKKKKHEVIWKTGNEVQPELDKLNRELNLTRGSMVQIMKRETKEGKNTETEEGDIIYGRLLTNGVDSNGFQIMVDGKEWTTTGINGICREWKTYYIGTEDSVYEIIPVESKSS